MTEGKETYNVILSGEIATGRETARSGRTWPKS